MTKMKMTEDQVKAMLANPIQGGYYNGCYIGYSLFKYVYPMGDNYYESSQSLRHKVDITWKLDIKYTYMAEKGLIVEFRNPRIPIDEGKIIDSEIDWAKVLSVCIIPKKGVDPLSLTYKDLDLSTAEEIEIEEEIK